MFWRILTFICFLTSAGCVSTTARIPAEAPVFGSPRACSDQNEILKILKANQLSPENFSAELKQSKALLFAGDAHSGSQWEDEYYIEIIRGMTNGDAQCLFLEQDYDKYQSQIDNPPELIMWRRSLQEAQKNGWKVFAVDEYEGCSEKHPENIREAIRCRNVFMSRRIVETGVTCKSGLAIVGTAHIDKPVLGENQTIMAMAGLNTPQFRTLNLKSTYALRWNPDCGHDLSLINNYRGRVNRKSVADQNTNVQRFFSDIWPVDFDYVILGGR